ncbi:MAG: hypothetical protein ABIF71_04850 [Planctomycetota bacterium]
MDGNVRGLVLGLAAIGSIVVGGAIAWFWGRTPAAGKPEYPVQAGVATVDPEDGFKAPATLPDGSIRSVTGTWENGNDRMVEYHRKDGTLTCTMQFYENGRKERELIPIGTDAAPRVLERGWFESGEPQFVYEKTGDQLDGPYLLYWPTGFPKGQGAYKASMKDGVWQVWNDRGIRTETAEFAAGVPHGMHRLLNEFGAPLESGRFDHGTKVGEWLYYDGANADNITRETYPEAGVGPVTTP